MVDAHGPGAKSGYGAAAAAPDALASNAVPMLETKGADVSWALTDSFRSLFQATAAPDSNAMPMLATRGADVLGR